MRRAWWVLIVLASLATGGVIVFEGVTSFNGEREAVTLSAGTGMTLSSDGGAFTLSLDQAPGPWASEVDTVDVASVNDSTGAVTVAAGSGITVTPSAPATFTIAATGGGGEVDTLDVMSVNDSTGAVILAAGSNITITPSSPNTFTIASTASGGEVDTLDVASVNDSTGAITLAAGANISVTPSSPGTFTLSATGLEADTLDVASFNDSTGAVTLTAGSNVTITPSAPNTFTIASSGGGGGGELPLWSASRDTLEWYLGPHEGWTYVGLSNIWTSWDRFKGKSNSGSDVTYYLGFPVPMGVGSRDTLEITWSMAGHVGGNVVLRWNAGTWGDGDNYYSGGFPGAAADTVLVTETVVAYEVEKHTEIVTLSGASSGDHYISVEMLIAEGRSTFTMSDSFVMHWIHVRLY